MSEFYKMVPAKWDNATAHLTLEQEAALLRIVNAINKNDAPVPNVDRVLAGLFRSSTRKARALIRDLIEAGKVYEENGFLWSEKAREDVVSRSVRSQLNAESGAKGGRTRAERAAKVMKDNDHGQATASSRIEEKRREEKGEANASPKKQGRATRLSEDWSLPMAWGRWALSEGWPEAVIREQADTFRDYWISASGKNATKLDWEATWRNWMRRVPKHHSNGGSNGRRTPVGSADPGFADRLARWDELDARASQAPGNPGYADFDADGDDGWRSADDRWSDRPGGFGTVVPLLQARGG
ncbi:DUF1376 domain-containing protein [Albimonas pacifica]|uniref:DUF1376 domain-containing protein n=1 Tax=Albimonas pacifica TaxID=1114924 RepID=A0A1I3LFV9_9RHOB|nr:DUF1376 domain-containing protein [Albimonas pacifica]SFI83694.1 Protein of unknown function [Albimonas pacifica]